LPARADLDNLFGDLLGDEQADWEAGDDDDGVATSALGDDDNENEDGVGDDDEDEDEGGTAAVPEERKWV
jgi:hypothetical protein